MLSTEHTGQGDASPHVLPDVLEESLEELAFVAIQGRKLRFSAEAGRAALEAIEAREAAHLDVLQTGGARAGEIAREALDAAWNDWEVYAAARVWLLACEPPVTEITDRIVATPEALLGGWREAFRRVPQALVTTRFPPGARREHPDPVRAVVADAHGWHGVVDTRALAERARDDAPGVRIAAARHGATAPAEALDPFLDDPDLPVRRRSLWSLALTHRDAACARCRAALGAPDADDMIVRVLGLVGSPVEDEPRLRERAGVSPAALRALGDLGSPASVAFLAAAASDPDPERAQAASEALARLLGPLDAGGLEEIAARSPRWLGGRPVPAATDDTDPYLASLWLGDVLAGRTGGRGPVREVPDGFFDGAPSQAAVAGE